MNAPLNKTQFTNQSGFSLVEVAIVVAMLAVILGFALMSFVKASRQVDRAGATTEIATFLQKARLDSMRRNARDVNQMSQVKIFNRRYYAITLDGDSDGQLDVPLVKALPENLGVEFEGPFPKTYIFDWLGQTVDSQNHRVPPPLIVVGNSAGASSIRFDNEGKVVVGSAVKISANR